MVSRDGRFVLTFNGEIYNHGDLRREMGEVAFRGHSDSETVLQALSKDGPQALERFNGIFALGFLDTQVGRLVLARDPFGVKPLYYIEGGDHFVFSSEIRPLQRLCGDELDPSRLAEVLRLRYLPAPDTLFRKIKKLRPGHLLDVDLSGKTLQCREVPFLRREPERRAVTLGEAVAEYGSLLEKAVERQLMSDVEVGVLLSGGVDSAVVASLARERVSHRMKAFTVGFADGEEADETSAAGETATTVGMEHFTTRLDFEGFLDAIARCVRIVEEPLATTSIVPMLHLAELAARHVKVVLSGQGADETLGGYRRYQGELLARWVPPVAARTLGVLAARAGVRHDGVRRALRALQEGGDLDRFLEVYSVFGDEEIRALIGRPETEARERLRYVYELVQCVRRPRGVERMMAVDARMNLADDLLLYTDKITMHHSLECRVPLLDLPLVRFLEALPARHRVRLGRTKILHKRFARRILPRGIVGRRKKGFASPTREWFRRGDALRGVLLDRAARFSSLFDLKAVDRVIREHEAGFNRERQIFLLLGLHAWTAENA